MVGAALLVLVIVGLQSVYCTPLDDYINKPDDTYKFEDLGNPDKEDGYTTYYINMTSQTWLSSKDLDRSIWWHYITINIPDVIKVTDTAFIYITGGHNSDTRPNKGSTDMLLTSLLSLTTGSVTATLFQIPNEPIVFKEDKLQKRRTEDAIIAFTWYYFARVLNGKNPEWLLRLPMTKAVVRAMDTVTTFSTNNNPAFKITKFVIGGASKRGWTTWTTGVVDKRVIGIVPIVMDLLNMVKNLHHHYRSLGGWTFAFNDYTDLNITKYLDDPTTQDIANVVDPYSYVDRLTMPKLIITTSGDEFFLPDNSYYYWDELQGEKHIRTIPNAEHSCAGHATSLMLTVRSFYLSLVLNIPRPKMTWTLNQTAHGGSITMRTNVKPNEVKMYHATTLDNKRRDFRLIALDPEGKPDLHPVFWSEKSLQAEPTGEYVATMKTPDSGWTAFFIQAAFKGPQESVLELTTQVNIIPNTFPFPDCHGIECQGKLV